MAARIKPVVIPSNASYLPPQLTQEICWALKGLNSGEADAGQQSLAISWIIQELCKTYDWPFRPESVRDTDIALGRQFCGQQLVRAINLTTDQVARLPKMRPSANNDEELPNQ